MKQLVLFSVMCLSTLFAQAQVMTSETINQVYATVSEENSSEFVYNGDRDQKGRLTVMTVYKKDNAGDGSVELMPVCHYLYDYTTDGLLKSCTNYVWRKSDWQCTGRHDFTLEGSNYTTAYSRWNKEHADFDPVAEQLVYVLLPDSSICQVSYYQRERHHDALKLAWRVPVENAVYNSDVFLTQK